MVTQKNCKVSLIIITIISEILCVLSIVPTMMTVMIFDAPGSTGNIGLWIVLLSMGLFTLLSFASPIVAWVVYSKKKYKQALWLTGMPLVAVLLVILGWGIASLG